MKYEIGEIFDIMEDALIEYEDRYERKVPRRSEFIGFMMESRIREYVDVVIVGESRMQKASISLEFSDGSVFESEFDKDGLCGPPMQTRLATEDIEPAKVFCGLPAAAISWLYANEDLLGLTFSHYDSSNYLRISGGTCDPSFPDSYIRYIKELIRAYNIVLIDSNEAVQEALREAGIDFYEEICLDDFVNKKSSE